MLITSQSPLKFNPEDQPAMDRRLTTYHFTSLPNPVKEAAWWLQTHPMDCILWAAQKAANDPDETIDDIMAHNESEGVLLENEKEALRNLSLSDILEHSGEEVSVASASTSATASYIDLSEDSQGSSTTHDEQDRIAKLENHLNACSEGTLRFRQISSMLLNERRIVEEAKKQKELRLQHRNEFLKARGVSTQEIEFLTQDETNKVYPAPIAAKLEEYDNLQKEKEKKERETTAQKAFQDKWLKDTEMKLYDLAQQKSSVKDRSTLAGIEGLIEILQHKLQMHHSKIGTLKMKEALEERRHFLRRLGFLHPTEEDLVDSLTCLPPLQSSQQHGSHDKLADTDSDGEDIFITPLPAPRKPVKKRALSQQPRASKKRKRSLPLSQGNTLEKYLKKNT